MKFLSIHRTIVAFAIVGLLAGCGGSQSQIGASGAVPIAPMVKRDTLITITVVSRKRTLPNVLVSLYLCPTQKWEPCVTPGAHDGKLVAHGKTNQDGNVDFSVTIKPKHTYCVEGEWKRGATYDCPRPPFPDTFTLHVYPV
jgi:hypothetical protein